MGVYLGLSKLEWGLIIFSIGLVLTAEVLNTAVERLGDVVAGGKYNNLVRDIKDISAGAVMVSALTALTIGVLILFVPFVQRVLG
jgi:diacylglycerol kinase